MSDESWSCRSADRGIEITQHLIITLPSHRLRVPLHFPHNCQYRQSTFPEYGGYRVPFAPPAPPRLRMSVGFRWLWLVDALGVFRFLTDISGSTCLATLARSMREVRFSVFAGGIGLLLVPVPGFECKLRDRCKVLETVQTLAK